MNGNWQAQRNRRLSERHDLALDITIRKPGGRQSRVRLLSFSAVGCLISGAELHDPGTRVWVRLPGLESQLAEVTRSAGDDVAVAFVRPLHPAVATAFAHAHSPKSHLGAWIEDRLVQLLDRRSEQRYAAPTKIERNLEVAGTPAVLRNFSTSGAQVETSQMLRLGSVVAVRFGTLPALRARVVRKNGSSAGLKLPQFALVSLEAA